MVLASDAQLGDGGHQLGQLVRGIVAVFVAQVVQLQFRREGVYVVFVVAQLQLDFVILYQSVGNGVRLGVISVGGLDLLHLRLRQALTLQFEGGGLVFQVTGMGVFVNVAHQVVQQVRLQHKRAEPQTGVIGVQHQLPLHSPG